MPAARILLVDADAASRPHIEGILTGVGYTVTTIADPDEAFAHATAHQVVVIDVVGGSKSAVDLCSEIRATPSMAGIPVLCVSQSEDVEERVRFLVAGADDVVA